MATQTEPRVKAPECTLCGVPMEFKAAGTERDVPLIGRNVEYERFSCPECGQGARFERQAGEEKWRRAGL